MGWSRIISAHAFGLLIVGGVFFLRPAPTPIERLALDGVERQGKGMALELSYLGSRAGKINRNGAPPHTRLRFYSCGEEPFNRWDSSTSGAEITISDAASSGRPGARLRVKDVSCMREWRRWSGAGYVTDPAVDWNKTCLSFISKRRILWKSSEVRATTAPGDLAPVGELCDIIEPVDPAKGGAAIADSDPAASAD